MRKEEHTAIGDVFEGKRQVIVEPTDKPLVLSSEETEKLFPNIHFTRKLEERIIIPPTSKMVGTFEVQDTFCFSGSLIKSKELCQSFGYDSFYRIKNPDEFAQIIFEELYKKVTLLGYFINKVNYVKKSFFINSEDEKKRKTDRKVLNKFTELCFSKPKEYSNQKEVRVIFVPYLDVQLHSELINNPKLLDYYDFPDF